MKTANNKAKDERVMVDFRWADAKGNIHRTVKEFKNAAAMEKWFALPAQEDRVIEIVGQGKPW